MKKYLITTCGVLLVIFLMISCGANKQEGGKAEDYIDKTEDYIIETNAGYRIEKTGDEVCLIITDDAYKTDENANVAEEVPSLDFASVIEMKNRVLGGKLTDKEMEGLSAFSKDADGSIKTVDFKKLYEPVLPRNVVCDGSINWYGGMYSFKHLECTDGLAVTFQVYTKERYQNVLQDNRDTIHNNDLVTITKTSTTDDRNATIYVYNTKVMGLMSIEYTIQLDDKEIFVVEDYMGSDQDVPYRVFLFGEVNGGYFRSVIRKMSSRPSVEWLSSFGLAEVK